MNRKSLNALDWETFQNVFVVTFFQIIMKLISEKSLTLRARTALVKFINLSQPDLKNVECIGLLEEKILM